MAATLPIRNTGPIKITRVPVAKAAVIGGLALLAGCATPPTPPPPPPPPPVEVIPPRPIPPGGAAYVMAIPPIGIDGQRLTVNRGLSPDEQVWHFRSAWNVAALNCTAPRFQPITDAYGSYISTHGRALSRVNSRIDEVYRKNYSSKREAIRAREAKMTSVYNFFALPPARTDFCNAALSVAQFAQANPGYDPVQFAATNFGTLEAPFETFFLGYEQYQRDSAAWDARYGERYGASQPGYVAVQAARGGAGPAVGSADPSGFSSQPTSGTTLTDPETGARIPVVPVEEGVESTPIIQPIPTDGNG